MAVTLLAGSLRFAHLGHPGELVFDEVYYPKVGCILIGWSDEVCKIDSGDEKYWRNDKWDVGSWVHPPLGKWQIGMGIKAFGMDPFGWRFTSALAGTLVVLLIAVIIQMLFRKPVWTLVGGTLMSLEGMNVVMSRTAILDVHLELWVVAGFLLLVLDRRWIERRQARIDQQQDAEEEEDSEAEEEDGEGRVPLRACSPVWRPYRFAAGAAFGAATAVKWSGAMALFAAVLLSFMWEVSRRRRRGATFGRATASALGWESFGMALAFVVVPLGVHMLTWLPWLNHFDWDWAKWWDTQKATFRYHRSGIEWTNLDPDTGAYTPTHPYYSRPWEWFFMIRPISFFVKDLGPDIQQIHGIGHPLIFWANVLAIPFLAFAWRRLRDWRAGFIMVAFAGQYLPWFLVGRPTFFFYVLPLTPFMVLAITYMCRVLSDATIVVRDRVTGEIAINPETGRPAVSRAYVYRPFVWAYLVAAVALFIWFWPVWTAGQISDVRWRAIVWFNRWI